MEAYTPAIPIPTSIMHTSFSENRLLAQRSPDTPRGVELPSANEFRDVMNRIEKNANDFMRNLFTPENKAQFNRVVETFNKELNQVTTQLVSSLRTELPKIGEYIRMGGRSGSETGRYSWDSASGLLANLLGRNGGPRREFTVPVAVDETASLSFEDEDGTVDFLDLHGSGEENFQNPGSTTYLIDNAGMQRILNEARTENGNYSKERTRVLDSSLSQLQALRGQILGASVVPTRTATTVAPTTTTTPTTAETGRTNLQPLAGETRDQQRARLERSLADARTAFNAQKAIVDRLVAAGSATPAEQLKTEREKLVKLEQDVIGFEGQITALRGERVSDTPQPI